MDYWTVGLMDYWTVQDFSALKAQYLSGSPLKMGELLQQAYVVLFNFPSTVMDKNR
jgi:hypothetical protein